MEGVRSRPATEPPPLDVEQQRELAGRVIPLSGVVALGPRRPARRAPLPALRPPTTPTCTASPVAPAQLAHVAPQTLEPQPPLPRKQATPGQRPAHALVVRPADHPAGGRHASHGGPFQFTGAANFRSRAIGEPHSQPDLRGRDPPVEQQRMPGRAAGAAPRATTSGRRAPRSSACPPPLPVVQVVSLASSFHPPGRRSSAACPGPRRPAAASGTMAIDDRSAWRRRSGCGPGGQVMEDRDELDVVARRRRRDLGEVGQRRDVAASSRHSSSGSAQAGPRPGLPARRRGRTISDSSARKMDAAAWMPWRPRSGRAWRARRGARRPRSPTRGPSRQHAGEAVGAEQPLGGGFDRRARAVGLGLERPEWRRRRRGRPPGQLRCAPTR